MSFDTFVHVLELGAVGLLFSCLISVTAGMVLRERRRGYRLPYEQPRHVRIVRGDES